MSFEEIEARRAGQEIPIAKLCKRADVDPSTYHKVRKGDINAIRFKTVSKLAGALKAIIQERAEASGR